MGKFFKQSLLAGIFITVPIFVSLWIAWFIYDALTSWGVEFSEKIDFGMEISEFWKIQIVRIASLLLMTLVLLTIGAIARNTIGKRIVETFQRILLKIPFIKTIYSTSRQVGDALWNANGGDMFNKAVLFEYPRRGSWAVGFLTNENKEQFEVTRVLGKELVSVFIPTTPNPTSGFLFLIPRDECYILNMSVSEAMAFIVSCGAVVPPDKAAELTEQTEKTAERVER
ncbi:MAG: DUF502 domain-containing protein [Lentisphaeria bacterium]|nr:DUF502 domain-containing protein [Lentisphaeria bacterium]